MTKIAIIKLFGKKVGSVKLEIKDDISDYLYMDTLVIDIENFDVLLRAGKEDINVIHFFKEIKNKVDKMKKRLELGDYFDKKYDDIIIDLYNELDELNNVYKRKGMEIIDPDDEGMEND